MRKADATGDRFFWRAVQSAVGGALGGALLPVVPEVIGNLMSNKRQGPAVAALIKAFADNLDLIIGVALAGALAGTFWFLYRNRRRNAVEPEVTREQLANLLESCHRPEFKTRLPVSTPQNLPSPSQAQIIKRFLGQIGIFKSDDESSLPVSELADAFLCSLTAFLREPRDNFLCYWTAHPGTPEYNAARAMLRQIEEHRIGGRAVANVAVARRVSSGLAFIRMDVAAESRFLMIESHRWGNPSGWWFVGGTEEPTDGGDLANTVRREVNEEIGVTTEGDAVLDCSLLFPPSTDTQISGGYGILTEYHFHMFAVRLKAEHPKVKPLLQHPPPPVQIPLKDAVRVHQFRWLSWDELLTEPHLLTHTPYLLDAIKARVKPAQLPVTAAIT